MHHHRYPLVLRCFALQFRNNFYGVPEYIDIFNDPTCSVYKRVTAADLLYDERERAFDDDPDALRDFADGRITDAELADAETRFPVHPPATKEAYLYRMIFEEQFPEASAIATVPGGKSIACSSEAALAWDPSFAGRADPSGRSVAGVHREAT